MDAADLRPDEIQDLLGRIQRSESDWNQRDATGAGTPAVVTGPDGLAHYRVDELWEEIAYLGYHLHWGLETLLDMEHRDRRRMVSRVAALNERAWEEVRNRGP